MGRMAAWRDLTGALGDTSPSSSGELRSGSPGRAIDGEDESEPETVSPEVQSRVREAVQRYEKPLVRYVLHLTRDVELARDVVQEAFLRLCNQPENKVGSYLAEWLYTVCRHLAIDLKRKESRMRLLTDSQADQFTAHDDEPANSLKKPSRSPASCAMSELPPNQQECIRLKFQHGLNYKQISQVTRLTVTNVGFLIHTGLKKLRAQLADADAYRSAHEEGG